MDPDDLTTLLAAGGDENAERSPACPDEHLVAGYVDGGLDEPEREQVELHLADCGRCLALVGLLSRARETNTIEIVPTAAVAQARALVTKRPERRWWVAPQWAAAAAVILAVPLLLQIGRNLDRGTEGQGSPAPAVTRTLPSTARGLQVLTPAAGATMDLRRMSFQWTDIPGTPYYDFRIVTDAGDVVIEQRVAGTTWQPPAQLTLQPGAEYFVHVEAYPTGDKALSSEHVPFRVAK